MGGCNVLVNSAGLLRDAMLVKKDKVMTPDADRPDWKMSAHAIS